MGIINYEAEHTSTVPREKLFKAIVDDSSDVIPKAIPQAIKSIDITEGDGGVGSIRQINFTDASPIKFLKEKVDLIDRENFIYGYTVLEGESSKDVKIEKIYNEVKFEAGPDGGTIIKASTQIHTLEGFEAQEDQIQARKEKARGLFKAIEAYLLAN